MPALVQGPAMFQARALQEAQQLGAHAGSLNMPNARLPLLSCLLASWSYRAGGPEDALRTMSFAPTHTPPRQAGCAWSTGSKGQGYLLSLRTQIRGQFSFQSFAWIGDKFRAFTETPEMLWGHS